MTFSSTVLYSNSLWVRTSSSTTLHAAANATFVLYIAGTSTPATVFADSNFTVARTDGKVTTDSNGNYSAWLDRSNNYEIFYQGIRYPAFDPDPTGQELQAELGNHASQTSGVHGATAGDPLASQGWVNTAIGNAASGGATPDATTSVKGKLALASDLAGTADAPVIAAALRTKITGAEQTSSKGNPNGYASLDGTGKIPTAQIPSTGASPDATTSAKGIVQLAGDLAGTAAAPAVESTLRAKITGAEQSANKGNANGYASLDSGGKVPSAQLPAGGFSGDFGGAIAKNYRDNWIPSGTSTTTVTVNETTHPSGSIFQCQNTAGTTYSFPKTAQGGDVWGVQQANSTGKATVQCADTSNGSFMVNADGQYRTEKQNVIIWVRCMSNPAGNNAGFIVDGRTVA